MNAPPRRVDANADVELQATGDGLESDLSDLPDEDSQGSGEGEADSDIDEMEEVEEGPGNLDEGQ